jgi:predicted enzyme related to lactoylglutathione lyase
MSIRDESILGEPCWVDLMSSDTAAARDFYTRLFGWTTTEAGEEYGNYITFRDDDDPVAGLAGPMPGAESPNAWMTYVSVADADTATDAARGAGATVIAEPMTVGEQGRMAIIADPSGAVIGLWQPVEHTGYRRFGEAGTPVWHELNTRDWDAATAFYQKVFGWQLQPLGDSDEFRYSTFGHDEVMPGGIYDAEEWLPAGAPSHWQVYFGVPDVAAAAARVPELGGTVLREPWTSDYGTFAQVTDPTGAMFLLSSVDESNSVEDS